MGRQELAVRVVEQDQRSVGPHEGVAGLIVEQPDLHVGRVRHVHDVHRVKQENPIHVGFGYLVDSAV